VSTRLRAAFIAVLLADVGVWQVGEGAWIYFKAELAQHLLRQAWARTQAGESDVKPWPWADTWPVARLRAPAHGEDLIVLADSSGRTLAFGPGLAPESGRPGATGTTIISGHRDTHFHFLERVRPGDELVLEVPGRSPIHYRVEDTGVVDARTAVIDRAPGAAGLVLLTCYPFNALRPGGPLRWIVSAGGES